MKDIYLEFFSSLITVFFLINSILEVNILHAITFIANSFYLAAVMRQSAAILLACACAALMELPE